MYSGRQKYLPSILSSLSAFSPEPTMFQECMQRCFVSLYNCTCFSHLSALGGYSEAYARTSRRFSGITRFFNLKLLPWRRKKDGRYSLNCHITLGPITNRMSV